MDEDKLNQIIHLLEQQNETLKKLQMPNITSDALEKAKQYMMKHHNIQWMNDSIESDVYDVIIEVIKKFI